MVCKQEEMRKVALTMIKSDGLILELGCGNGNFAKLLSDNGYKNYLGIDIISNNIKEAKKLVPNFDFWAVNVFASRVFSKIKEASTIVSFQTFEHLGTRKGNEDIDFLLTFPQGKHFIFSVPNSPYLKEHKRWFELEGWKKRYGDILNYKEAITIQNPKKKDKRSFLFNSEVK